MNNIKSVNKNTARFLSLIFILMIVFTIFFTAIPFGNIVNADDDGGVSNLSMYNRASELAREFGTSLAPGTEQDFKPMIENANAGTAGGLLGYADVMSDDNAVIGWLTSSFTTASYQLTYDQLEHITGTSKKRGNPFYEYAGYGEALNTMGLSKTVRGDSGKFGRLIPTGYLMFMYMIASLISLIISLALNVLTMLNPFKLFMGVFDVAAASDLGILAIAAGQVKIIYESIQSISLYVLLPAFLIITVFSVLVFAKGQAFKRFARYGLRVFMIFAGLPLIGATYTGVVEDLSESVSSGNMVAEYLVYSSYVDFENWVKHSRLAPPADTSLGFINHPRLIENSDHATDRMYTPSRQFILYLNGYQAGNEKAADIYEQFQDGGLTDVVGELEYVDSDSANFGEGGLYQKQTPFDLLRRHINYDKYSSSHYDGEVTGLVQKAMDNELDDNSKLSAKDTEILRMFTMSASKHRTWQKTTDLKVKVHGDDAANDKWLKKAIDWSDSTQLLNPNPDTDAEDSTFRFTNFTQNIYNGGTLGLTYHSQDERPDDVDYQGSIGFTSDGVGVRDPLHNGDSGGGLSPLAMYNFLNTTFDDTGLTIWSSERSSSDQTRDTYVSIVHGSTGVSAVLRWFETASLISAMNILTIAFGVMMIQVALTGIPRILTSVFGTALGSIASITKLLISTAVMLLQFIGMMFLYYLSENIIVGVMVGIDSFVHGLDNYFSSIALFVGTIGLLPDGVNLVTGNVFLQVGMSIFMIIIVWAVTIFMIKNIGTFKNMLEEMVTDGIQRLMSGLDVSTGGQGVDPAKVSGGGGGSRASGGVGGDDKPAGGLRSAHDLAATEEAQLKAAGASDDEIYGEGAGDGGLKGGIAKAKGKLRNRFADKDGTGSLAGNFMKAAAKDNLHDSFVKPFTGGSGQKLNRAKDAELKDIDRRGRANTHQRVADENNKGGNSGNSENNTVDVTSKLPDSEALMFNDNNELLDTNGDVYTDENGNALIQDDNGNLVDIDGDYARVGDDGVLEKTDTPHNFADEADRLDDMRQDGEANEAMLEAQNNTHHGIDALGQVVNADGEPVKTKSGLAVGLDDEGRMVDENGNFVSPSDLKESDIDKDGYDKKVDGDGNEYLQHKGEGALRDGAKLEDGEKDEQVTVAGADGQNYNVRKGDVGKSVTSMAKEANSLENRAKRARDKVNRLKASGASSYAISQAQGHANKLTNKAKDAQGRYSQHVASGMGRSGERVSPAHVDTAKRAVNTAKQSYEGATQKVKDEQAKLKTLQQANKPVNDQRAVVQKAQQSQKQASTQLEKAQKSMASAERQKQEAFSAYTREATPENKKRYDSAVAKSNTAKGSYSQAQQTVQATQQAVTQSQTTLGQLEQQNQATVQAESKQRDNVKQAQETHKQAKQSYQNSMQSEKYVSTAYQAKRSYGEVEKAHTQQRQTQGKFNQAYQAVVQAEKSGNQQQIQRARQQFNQESNDLSYADAEVSRVAQQPQGTVQQIDKANAEVSRLRNGLNNATGRKKAQYGRQLRHAEQRLDNLQKPKGWFGGKAQQEQVLSNMNADQNKTRQQLKAQGVVSYDDYANRLANEQASTKDNRVKLGRINDMLQGSNDMPASRRTKLESQRTELRSKIGESNKKMNDLRKNAVGMLDGKGFTSSVASRPIKQHGGMVVTQLTSLSGMQKMHNSLKYRQDSGTLDSSGVIQLQELESRMGHARRELVGLGIQEEYINDSTSIQNSISDVQRAWLGYMNGKG